MTNNIPYTPPAYGAEAFNCPHCGAYSTQIWNQILSKKSQQYPATHQGAVTEKNFERSNLEYSPSHIYYAVSKCLNCISLCFWQEGQLVYPNNISTASPANEDMPKDIKKLYQEAAEVVGISPRAAAALLRLALQKLCIELGGKGESIYKDIDILRKEKGLPSEIIKAAEIVRIIGNNAVHPGVIDFEDSSDIANKLFLMINIIADRLITNMKAIDELYANEIPDSQKRKTE